MKVQKQNYFHFCQTEKEGFLFKCSNIPFCKMLMKRVDSPCSTSACHLHQCVMFWCTDKSFMSLVSKRNASGFPVFLNLKDAILYSFHDCLENLQGSSWHMQNCSFSLPFCLLQRPTQNSPQTRQTSKVRFLSLLENQLFKTPASETEISHKHSWVRWSWREISRSQCWQAPLWPL